MHCKKNSLKIYNFRLFYKLNFRIGVRTKYNIFLITKKIKIQRINVYDWIKMSYRHFKQRKDTSGINKNILCKIYSLF